MVDSDKRLFLASDLKALRERVASLEATYKSALGGIHETTTYSTESWHDNPAFDDAQQQSRMYYRQYRELRDVLDVAEEVTAGSEDGTVGIGSAVAVRYEQTGRREDFVVCSYMCFHDDEAYVSYISPLGAVLLGRAVGDHVLLVRPGRDIPIEILDVR